MNSDYRFILYMIVFVFAALSGCARSPQVTFYTLAPLAENSAVGTPPPFSVAVAPVTLPELVDRPQLVFNTASYRVQILETHRWAEPLKSAIPRMLADNLSRLLGSERVASYPQSAFSNADFRVMVDILRFESTADTVLLEGLCTIRRDEAGAEKNRRFRVKDTIRGEGNGERVAAYSRALATLSREIAAFLREGQAPQ